MSSRHATNERLRLAICLLILVIITMWTYYGSTGNAFVWDSAYYLVTYVDHFSSLDWNNLKWMATSLEVNNWHPFTWLSWAVDYQLYGGLAPWGYHFTNNLLHTLNSVLLFLLILMVFGFVFPSSQKFSIRLNDSSLAAAFFASVLFAVHPQHVESVAWVAERKDLLCQIFMLLTIISYMKYVASDQLSRRAWYVVSLGLYFCAVLSKPMAVTLPVILLLIDVFPLARSKLVQSKLKSVGTQSFVRLFIEKLPFFLLSSSLVLITVFAQKTSIQDLPLWARGFNAIHSVLLYLEKLVFPSSLNPYYPYFVANGEGNFLSAVLMVIVVSLITVAVAIAWKRKQPAWLISWLIYLVALSPVLGLIQVGTQGAADRYSYFPTLPFYILVAGGIYMVINRGKGLRTYSMYLVLLASITIFVIQTKQQIGVWQSELSLWTHAVKMDPANKFAHNNLGIAYRNIGDYESAIQHFEAGEVHSSGPNSILAFRATAYMHLGRYRKAIDDLVELGAAADIRSELVVDEDCIKYDVGWSFAHLKMYKEAFDLFERVDQKSGLKANAEIWVGTLNFLLEADKNSDLPDDLPGLCENLMPTHL